MLRLAHDAGLPNLAVHVGDAVALLTERVERATLSGVHIFFPDPWPKNKHAKRRLIGPATLDLLHDRLRPQAALLVATDQDHYARHTVDALAAHGGYDVVLGERPSWRPTDGFEAKGLAAGHRISEIRATRR